MSTSLHDMYKEISKITGKIIKDNELELHGPKESLDLLLKQVESIREIFSTEFYETCGDTQPLNLTVEKINPNRLLLSGEWQVFEKYFEKHNIKIEHPAQKDTMPADRIALLSTI